jgi:ABC-type lipoprotein release transport system permease subunit
LPDTQVIEYSTQALVRAEARNRAAQAAREELAEAAARSQEGLRQAAALAEQERQQTAAWAADAVRAEQTGRDELRREKEEVAAWLVPVVLIGCVVWVGLLTFSNVRDRSVEIGILRALGLRQRQILMLFLGKAALTGFLGALLGYGAGLAVAAVWGEAGAPQVPVEAWQLALVLAAAPVLCALAGWMPALLAARQDPAVILREA